jgi:capsular polysaccharide export protein
VRADPKDELKREPWQRVLLLQGPVGPFFYRLRKSLKKLSFHCFQVLFNPGDRLFAGYSKGTLIYRGDMDGLEDWLCAQAIEKAITHMVVFGSERPIHVAARRVADEQGIAVISLEEGYIRPGAITLEFGANNALSPIAGQLPPRNFRIETEGSRTACLGNFPAMCVYGGFYYGAIAVLARHRHRQRQILHRNVSGLDEIVCWTKNLHRWLLGQSKNRAIVEHLLEHHVGHYFVVPLQVAQDTQLKRAARGWNNARLITDVLSSFAASAAKELRLVFKIHPLERGRDDDHRLIDEIATKLGIRDRVDIVDVGSIGYLTRRSVGMATINSTSGFSAIHHGVPLLVIGDAVYANNDIATCAFGNPNFDAFWEGGTVASALLRKRYIAWIRHRCLRPGDFFTTHGIEASCKAVVDAIRSPTVRRDVLKEAA